jgi:hypothetical protein
MHVPNIVAMVKAAARRHPSRIDRHQRMHRLTAAWPSWPCWR